MSGGIFSIRRRLEDRRLKKAIKKDEKRRIQLNIKQPAAEKESKKVGYFPEFPPRVRLPSGKYDVAVHKKLIETDETDEPDYANAPNSSGSYAIAGLPPKAIAGLPPKASYASIPSKSSPHYENPDNLKKPEFNENYLVNYKRSKMPTPKKIDSGHIRLSEIKRRKLQVYGDSSEDPAF